MTDTGSPKVSIIIPTRNRPALLADALAGIKIQTFADYEAIVVDDGSTPENRQVCRELLEAFPGRSKLVQLECDYIFGTGPSAVRNAGIKASKAEIIAFCDDDDSWIDPDHLATAVSFLESHKDIRYFFANQKALQGGVEKSAIWLPKLENALPELKRIADEIYEVPPKLAFNMGHFPHLNTTVLRRDLVEEIGGFWEMARYSGDLDFFARAADASPRIAYRNSTVSLHNIPDRAKKANASTYFPELEKQALLSFIGDHIRINCRSAAAQSMARRVQGTAYKILTEASHESGNRRAAAAYARLGLATLPTVKWALFCAYLNLRALGAG